MEVEAVGGGKGQVAEREHRGWRRCWRRRWWPPPPSGDPAPTRLPGGQRGEPRPEGRAARGEQRRGAEAPGVGAAPAPTPAPCPAAASCTAPAMPSVPTPRRRARRRRRRRHPAFGVSGSAWCRRRACPGRLRTRSTPSSATTPRRQRTRSWPISRLSSSAVEDGRHRGPASLRETELAPARVLHMRATPWPTRWTMSPTPCRRSRPPVRTRRSGRWLASSPRRFPSSRPRVSHTRLTPCPQPTLWWTTSPTPCRRSRPPRRTRERRRAATSLLVAARSRRRADRALATFIAVEAVTSYATVALGGVAGGQRAEAAPRPPAGRGQAPGRRGASQKKGPGRNIPSLLKASRCRIR